MASHIFTVTKISQNKAFPFVVLLSSKREILLLSDTSISYVTYDQSQKPFQVCRCDLASKAVGNSETRVLMGVLQDCVLALCGFLVFCFFLKASDS